MVIRSYPARENVAGLGRVLLVANSVARVATPDGVLEMPFDGGVGDRVTV